MLEVLRSSTGEPNQSTPNSIRALQILGASMRRQLLPIILAVSLVGFAGFARADGYENPRAAAPVPLQVSNWTGFYANGVLVMACGTPRPPWSTPRPARASSAARQITAVEDG